MWILNLFGRNNVKKTPEVKSDYINYEYGYSYPIITKKFDGEKTQGELGIIINNIPDFERIRMRAFDADMKNDTIKTIIKRYSNWVVGSGLKLQSEPEITVLNIEGIDIDKVLFSEKIEALFKVWSNSKHCDYSGQNNLNKLASQVQTASFIGGDCLVICRVINRVLKVQIIDGSHVKNPDYDELEKIKSRGNFIKYGVEYNVYGDIISYYVDFQNLDKEKTTYTSKVERVLSKNNKGSLMAWMVYGSKARIDHKRGISRISHILEKSTKLDRYAEASVGKAEQGANIAHFFEHDKDSLNDNPLKDFIKNKAAINGNISDTSNEDPYVLGDKLANKITQTTSNQVYILPQGVTLKSFQGNTDNNFDAFYNSVYDGLAAACDVPPEVAKQKYSSNYSASRAAIGGWDYIIDIDRDDFSTQFYKNVFNLFLELNVYLGKIDAPGYIEAKRSGNFYIIESYQTCRFIGKKMPHIDPIKEVKAIVEMINNDLISREQAGEALNIGSWRENFTKKQEEDKLIPKEEVIQTNINTNGNTESTNTSNV